MIAGLTQAASANSDGTPRQGHIDELAALGHFGETAVSKATGRVAGHLYELLKGGATNFVPGRSRRTDRFVSLLLLSRSNNCLFEILVSRTRLDANTATSP